MTFVRFVIEWHKRSGFQKIVQKEGMMAHFLGRTTNLRGKQHVLGRLTRRKLFFYRKIWICYFKYSTFVERNNNL